MKTTDIKTIDIQTLKWHDKVCGNTYFAQRITLNFGMDDQEELVNPFEYGYSSYTNEAFLFLSKNIEGFPRYQSDLNSSVIVRSNERYALKRELKNI